MIRRNKQPILNEAKIEVALAAGVTIATPVEEDDLPVPDLAPQFPQELKLLNRWIVRTVDKKPYSAFEEDEGIGPIDPHDKQFQSDYNTAMGALDSITKFSGAGFVFNYADGLTGIDFDNCVNSETGEIRADIQEIITRVNSYTEITPSRSGVHIFVRGWQFPIGPSGEQGSKVGKAEIYSGKRYFTVTGNHVVGTPTTIQHRDLGWLYERIVKNREFFEARVKSENSSASFSESSCVVTIKNPGLMTTKYNTLMKGAILRSKDTTGSTDFAIEDDAQILEYESQSSADYALLRLIIDRLNTEDTDKIKEEFRNSPLGERPKADREDYLDHTIIKLLKEPRRPFINHVVTDGMDETGISIDRPKLLTEVGNARRLIEAYGKNIRYCPEDDCWLYFGGKVWLKDKAAVHVHDLMKRVLIGMQTEAGALAGTVSPDLLGKLNKDLAPKTVNVPLTKEEIEENEKKNSKSKFKKVTITLTDEESKALEDYKTAHAFLDWSKTSESNHSIKGAIGQAQSEPGVSISKSALDTNTLICNVQNGVFRFSPAGDVVFEPHHKRDDLATKMMPVTYDPSAVCPQFDAFLSWMFPCKEDQEYTQKYFGLCLTGLVVRTILILCGGGRNGKGTLMKVFYKMLGEVLDKNGASEGGAYYKPVAFSTFAVGREEQAGGARADLVPLKGARLITASESNKKGKKNSVTLNMAFLKELTGGDPTVARGMYEADEITFFNQGKIVLQTNNLPDVNDDTDSSWDRLSLLECKSRVEDGKEDERLAEKLQAEASGILNWMLEGLRMYFKEGLLKTESIRAATERYRGAENHMNRFGEDELETGLSQTIRTPTSEIYGKYKYWCQNNGEQPESQRAMTQYFQRRLGIEGDLPHDREKGNCLPGVQLKTQAGPVATLDGDKITL
jgi:putative DNA primase/helicase